jgi:hypothetical protein
LGTVFKYNILVLTFDELKKLWFDSLGLRYFFLYSLLPHTMNLFRGALHFDSLPSFQVHSPQHFMALKQKLRRLLTLQNPGMEGNCEMISTQREGGGVPFSIYGFEA